MVYLDNAASSPILPSVKDVLINSLEIYGNPSSLHSQGYLSAKLIHEASDKISQKIKCDVKNLYYTSGASMGNSLLIQGFLSKNPKATIVISSIEHNDIIELSNHLGSNVVRTVPVNMDGTLRYDILDYLLKDLTQDNCNPILCSIQAANGECGVINDINRISDIVHKYHNVYFHTDATQYIPYFPIDLSADNIDALSMSGQKIGSIKGTGLLYINDRLKIDPIIFGKQGLIGGTENVHGIVALGEAFKSLTYDNKKLYSLRDYFIDKISSYGDIVGTTSERLPNNVFIHFENIDSESMVVLLNEFGICASSGAACSSGTLNGSHVVKAMGYSEDYSKHCVRFTVGSQNTFDELDYVAELIRRLTNGFC